MQLLSPKIVKFKKRQKGKLRPINSVSAMYRPMFGDFSIVSAECGRVTARHIESMRKTIRRLLKRSGKIWVPVFPHWPVSAKPLEVRMGKGKGAQAYWTSTVNEGALLLSLSGVSFRTAVKVLTAAGKKLPVKTRFVCSSFGVPPKHIL